MMIRAYDEDYLRWAQRILGDAFDFSVNTLNIPPDKFMEAFIISGCAKQFEAGNPTYVVGITGCELARIVLDEVRMDYPDAEDVMYTDKSPAYWAGWALAFYQWYTCKSFSFVHAAVPVSEVLRMYPVYHEMDVLQFVEELDRRLKVFYPDTRLHAHRVNCGYSQRELAEASGVPLRQIQLFEQRVRDINKTQAINLFRLSRVLHCAPEALLEL